MKRIGVVTYWNSLDNYGQVLQCYALQQYLISEGYDAFLIKYAPENKDTIVKKIGRNLSIRKVLYFFSSERKAQKERDRETEREDQKARELAKQCRFDEFRSQNIKSTSTVYKTIEELRSKPPEADAYICGSDQVWNNSLYEKNTGGWYLAFGNAPRISYAASIGRVIADKEQKKFSNYLKQFKAVSVREKSAQECCKKNGREDAIIAIDPTILLGREGFQKLIIPETGNKDYIFIYALNVDNTDDIHWQEIERISEDNRVAVEVCCSSGYITARDFIPGHPNQHLTVQEWLSTIKNAKFVVTSSFHGTVFCLLMHVPFVSIPLSNKFSRANDRIRDLLHSVGLEERFLENGREIGSLYSAQIDWKAVDQRLSAARIESSDFLREALNGI